MMAVLRRMAIIFFFKFFLLFSYHLLEDTMISKSRAQLDFGIYLKGDALENSMPEPFREYSCPGNSRAAYEAIISAYVPKIKTDIRSAGWNPDIFTFNYIFRDSTLEVYARSEDKNVNEWFAAMHLLNFQSIKKI